MTRVLFLILLCYSTPLISQTTIEGGEKPDYEKVLPLALKGDPVNQARLGKCYENGIGVPKDEKLAFEWYLKSAEQGNSLGQAYLGRCYRRGIGVAKDEAKGTALYNKSAEQGDAIGQLYLGTIYFNGLGVPKNQQLGCKYFRMSAEQGNADAQCNLGTSFENGYGVTKDEKAAFEWYEKAANSGQKYAQTKLGYFWLQGIACYKTPSIAFQWFQKAAEQGDSQAQSYIGYCYDKGIGVSQDKAEAFKWFKKSAEQDNIWGQVNVGVCLQKGSGVDENIAEAVKWFSKASEKGDAEAMGYLGVMYTKGAGIPKDVKKGFDLLSRAAEKGSLNAQLNLGVCYFCGEGTEKNTDKGIEWITKAANAGFTSAQIQLGYLYAKGEGTKIDNDKAAFWFRQASSSGEKEALYNLAMALTHADKTKMDSSKWIAQQEESSEILNKLSLSPLEDDYEANLWIGRSALEVGAFDRAKNALLKSGISAGLVGNAIEPDKMSILMPDDKLAAFSVEILNSQRETIGSGVFYGKKGWVITAAHVVAGADKLIIRDCYMQVWDVLGVFPGDFTSDLAILSTNANQHPAIDLSDKKQIYAKDLYLIGHPFGSTRTVKTKGAVDNNLLSLDFNAQIPALPGNSGSPVFNENNELVGIATEATKFIGEKKTSDKPKTLIEPRYNVELIASLAQEEAKFSDLSESKLWKGRHPSWDTDRRCAKNDFIEAQAAIGGFYEKNRKADAVELLSKSAEKGNHDAQRQLGSLKASGKIGKGGGIEMLILEEQKLLIKVSDSSSAIPLRELLSQTIRSRNACIIWNAFTLMLVLGGIIKTWKIVKSKAPPLQIKVSVIVPTLYFYYSLILLMRNELYFQITSDNLKILDLFALLLVISAFVSTYWLFAQPCALGSRMLLYFGGLFSLIGAIGIPYLISKDGNTALLVKLCAVLGFIPFVSSLLKTSKAFRKRARTDISKLPRVLIVSLVINAFFLICFTAKDIVGYPVIFLFNLFIILPLLGVFFYWALKWTKRSALWFYRGILMLGASFAFANVLVLLKSASEWMSVGQYFLGAVAFAIPLVLTFHSTVRVWCKDTPPVLHAC